VIHNFLRGAEKREDLRSLESLGELDHTTDLRETYLEGTSNELVRNNPPYHLLTDAGLGGFPVKPFLLGVFCMLSGGIFKLSTMTLARCIRPSNANLSALKDVTGASSV